MKKGILRCFVFILAGMIWALTLSAQDEDIESINRSTWQMTISLETKSLKPPAVQWAIFDKDPVPDFLARVKQKKDNHKERLERSEGTFEKEIIRSTGMMVNWDLGFKEVSGDKVYLLTRARGVSFGIVSDNSDGKKWIVSKTVQIKDKPVCWCIPVAVDKGKKIDVVLTDDNMFDLEAAFDKALGEE